MIGRRRSGRLWQGLLLLWLPTLILLGALNLRRQLPGLPQGANRQAVLEAGDFAVNRYTDAQGQEYLDFTISIQGKTRTLIDRVYDYRVQEGKIYARGVTGAAAADPSAGACRLYVSKQYPRYRQAWPGVTLVDSIQRFPLADYRLLQTLGERYQAFPDPAPNRQTLLVLGCGRFRIEQVSGADGFRRLQLADAQARELAVGYTVRIFRDIESYQIENETLYIRAREGYACLRPQGGEFTVVYFDYGSKIYYSTMPDIHIERDLSALPPHDRLLLSRLPSSNRL